MFHSLIHHSIINVQYIVLNLYWIFWCLLQYPILTYNIMLLLLSDLPIPLFKCSELACGVYILYIVGVYIIINNDIYIMIMC